jgi:hypothetical protein
MIYTNLGKGNFVVHSIRINLAGMSADLCTLYKTSKHTSADLCTLYKTSKHTSADLCTWIGLHYECRD